MRSRGAAHHSEAPSSLRPHAIVLDVLQEVAVRLGGRLELSVLDVPSLGVEDRLELLLRRTGLGVTDQIFWREYVDVLLVYYVEFLRYLCCDVAALSSMTWATLRLRSGPELQYTTAFFGLRFVLSCRFNVRVLGRWACSA